MENHVSTSPACIPNLPSPSFILPALMGETVLPDDTHKYRDEQVWGLYRQGKIVERGRVAV